MSTPYNEVGPTNADNYSLMNRPLWDMGFDFVDLDVNDSQVINTNVNLGGL